MKAGGEELVMDGERERERENSRLAQQKILLVKMPFEEVSRF